MIAVVDYGVGNLFSLTASLKMVGADSEVTSDPERILAADKIILPGVGAFGDAAQRLSALHLDEVLRQAASRGTPLMGICLGMQLLFEKSYEFGEHAGLGLLKGTITPMQGRVPAELKIPQIGWNSLHKTKESKLLSRIDEGDFVYFVHSFSAEGCEDSLAAVTDYGATITAAVEKDNVCGCQFHPEKSGKVGLEILRAFCFGGESK
jgi:glutamine amidotransferase